MNSAIKQIEDYVANLLSSDSMLSATPVLSQNRRDISFEIKEALGRQGIVCVVMVEKANYVGDYQNDMLAWEIPSLVVEAVENEAVNRHRPNDGAFITAQEVCMRASEIICPTYGSFEGKFSPVSLENGENNSLLVSKATFRCIVHTKGPLYPPWSEIIESISAEIVDIKDDISAISAQLSSFDDANLWKKSDSEISAQMKFLVESQSGNAGFGEFTEEMLLFLDDDVKGNTTYGVDQITHSPTSDDNFYYAFPHSSGTIALLEDISANNEPISSAISSLSAIAINAARSADAANSNIANCATKAELNDHASNSVIHVTAADKSRWNSNTNALPLEVGSQAASSLKLKVSGNGACTANNTRAIALGYGVKATGNNAFGANNQTNASGQNSTAFGYQTSALGDSSLAMGRYTMTSGNASLATGISCSTYGNGSFAGGVNSSSRLNSIAYGDTAYTNVSCSFAFGDHVEASSAKPSFVCGSWNVQAQNPIFQIGCGDESLREDAMQISQNGNIYIKNIGGFNGQTDAERVGYASLQQVIANLQSKINELSAKIEP